MSGRISDEQEVQTPMQAGLDMAASLIRDPSRWNEWLSEQRDRWELYQRAFRQVIQLEMETRWQPQIVLSELGCQVQTTSELGQMDEAELRRCIDYFAWVEEIVGYLNTTDDKRRILSGAALLFRDSRGKLSECMHSMEAGTFSASELLKLGEIDKAWVLARIQLAGPIGDRARLLKSRNPFQGRRPHLSDERFDRYLDQVGGELDAEIRERIGHHLKLCPECRAAFAARRAGLSESRVAPSIA